MVHRNHEKNRESVKKLAEFLDSRFQLPFGIRIGWDGIIGLIPGLGDLITNSLSFYILYRAAMMGCPPSILLRMAFNIVIDNLVDLIPIVGALFDFIWKSNLKNVKLMDDYLAQPKQAVRSSRWFWTIAVLILLGSLAISLTVLFLSIKMIWRLVQGF